MEMQLVSETLGFINPLTRCPNEKHLLHDCTVYFASSYRFLVHFRKKGIGIMLYLLDTTLKKTEKRLGNFNEIL
jgi:hypothetical protein